MYRVMARDPNPVVVVFAYFQSGIEIADFVKDLAAKHDRGGMDDGVEKEQAVEPARVLGLDRSGRWHEWNSRGVEGAIGIGFPDQPFVVDDANLEVFGQVVDLGAQLAGEPAIISIEEADVLPGGVSHAGVARCGCAGILLLDQACFRRGLSNDIGRVVAGTIVDDKNFD